MATRPVSDEAIAAATLVNWPPLPMPKTATGSATPADVAIGEAVFAVHDGSEPRTQSPDIEVPQYGFLVDSETGQRQPVIVVQAAELLGGIQIVAWTNLDSSDTGIATPGEFELLGTDPAHLRRVLFSHAVSRGAAEGQLGGTRV